MHMLCNICFLLICSLLYSMFVYLCIYKYRDYAHIDVHACIHLDIQTNAPGTSPLVLPTLDGSAGFPLGATGIVAFTRHLRRDKEWQRSAQKMSCCHGFGGIWWPRDREGFVAHVYMYITPILMSIILYLYMDPNTEKVQKTLQIIVNHTPVPLPEKVQLDP